LVLFSTGSMVPSPHTWQRPFGYPAVDVHVCDADLQPQSWQQLSGFSLMSQAPSPQLGSGLKKNVTGLDTLPLANASM